MPVNVLQWCAGIRNFYKCTHLQIKIEYSAHFSFNIRIILPAFFNNLYYQIYLIQHGDIELNPGLNKKFKPLPSCDWTAHNSIEAYSTIHDSDFICISEIYLDSSVSLDNKDIDTEDHNIVRADHSSNHKKVVYAFII